MANLICTGIVLSISETLIKKDIVYFPNENPRAYPEKVMLAKLKVLHVFKGQAPAEIEFHYWAPRMDMFDGPNPVILEKDKRYRFFLKPDQANGGYIGVLDGQYSDDYAAVEGLWPNERDDGAYLKKEIAYKIAVAYARSKKIDAKLIPGDRFLSCLPETMEVVAGRGHFHGATWSLCLPFSGNIVVRGDGMVDVAKSWLKQ